MKRILASLLLAVALIVVQAAPVASAGKPKNVGISHFEFHPHTLHVARGSRVVFSNRSGTTHTATDAGAFDTGPIKPGHSIAVRFTQKGTFSYHCEIHPFMHGKIVVG